MAIFLVLALKDESRAKIEEAIKAKFPDEHYEIADDKWFVNVENLTARQLAERVGIIGGDPVRGLVVSVASYSGRAQPDMWEWLAAKFSKANA